MTRRGISALVAGAMLCGAGGGALAESHRRPIVIAHRGVYQQFSHENLGMQDCTATRIAPPVHPFLENTIPSIREAYRLGADVVEIDVATTSDGQVVVFHDWTLDCRTNGHGNVRDHSLAELKALDIGYRYTADGGRTFPFRGKGVGMMPTLDEVLHAFPGRSLAINFKSNDAGEADAVAEAFRRAGVALDRTYFFYGPGPAVIERMRGLAPRSQVFNSQDGKACTRAYLGAGGGGEVPAVCRGSAILVPVNLARSLPSWPSFLARMRAAGTRVVIGGDASTGQGAGGLRSPAELGEVPRDFDGYIWVEDMYALRTALPRFKRGGAKL